MKADLPWNMTLRTDFSPTITTPTVHFDTRNQIPVPGHPGNFYWVTSPDNMTVGPRYWDFNSADTAHVMRFIEEQASTTSETGTLMHFLHSISAWPDFDWE
ncbi:MAG: hypothetical protein R2787_04575 [Saprospiraceae bacterium]